VKALQRKFVTKIIVPIKQTLLVSP